MMSVSLVNEVKRSTALNQLSAQFISQKGPVSFTIESRKSESNNDCE